MTFTNLYRTSFYTMLVVRDARPEHRFDREPDRDALSPRRRDGLDARVPDGRP